MMQSVLDASALLAWLLNERGSDAVLSAIEAGAGMSAVNVAEVATRYALAGADAVAVGSMIDRLPFPVIDFDADLAKRTALLAPVTRAMGLSLGDRACLALAKRLHLPAITADQAWLAIAESAGVSVQVIR